ncbi:hypothetical protein LIER_37559 [Lithospermum erythrorhizon]|uniref:Uncharacterized protein n=1 Tax=Lithospermum erythrorhizon TaxID=34254 RepID=A0AAV3PPX8_LITER
MDVRGLTISHVKSHLQMYRSMKSDVTKQDKSIREQMQLYFEDPHHRDAKSIDEEDNCMAYNLREQTDSLLTNQATSPPINRARTQAMSCITEDLNCCKASVIGESLKGGSYSNNEYMQQTMVEKSGNEEKENSVFRWKTCYDDKLQPTIISTPTTTKRSDFSSLPQNLFHNQNPFINAASEAAPTYPLVDDIQESERRELPKEWINFEQILGVQHNYANEQSEDGLTLSLSLQQPPSIQPTSNNNNTSFISEISEAISYRSRISNNNNVEDLLGCSTKNHCIDLELSISLCGT